MTPIGLYLTASSPVLPLRRELENNAIAFGMGRELLLTSCPCPIYADDQVFHDLALGEEIDRKGFGRRESDFSAEIIRDDEPERHARRIHLCRCADIHDVRQWDRFLLTTIPDQERVPAIINLVGEIPEEVPEKEETEDSHCQRHEQKHRTFLKSASTYGRNQKDGQDSKPHHREYLLVEARIAGGNCRHGAQVLRRKSNLIILLADILPQCCGRRDRE